MVSGMRVRRRGFTLIELLVVLAIVATLLTLAVPRYFGKVDAAKETVLRENLRTTRDVIGKFYGDTGRYPESLERLQQAQKAHGKNEDAWDWLYLALVHHRLGHAGEARQWLEKAGRWEDLRALLAGKRERHVLQVERSILFEMIRQPRRRSIERRLRSG